MTIHHDYVPSEDWKLLTWGRALLVQVHTHLTEWRILQDDLDAVEKLLGDYNLALEIVEKPEHSSVDVKLKNETKDAFKKGIRQFVREYLANNHLVTDNDRERMAIPVHDGTRTPIPVPTTVPELFIRITRTRSLTVDFKEAGKETKGKPYGINGVVMIYDILDTPPTAHTQLTHSVLATRTPHVLDFLETERGKTAYVAVCWQNEKGEKGPWSDILNAIIP
jgi:hypothetical protein